MKGINFIAVWTMNGWGQWGLFEHDDHCTLGRFCWHHDECGLHMLAIWCGT
jgi:hypothetical protein